MTEYIRLVELEPEHIYQTEDGRLFTEGTLSQAKAPELPQPGPDDDQRLKSFADLAESRLKQVKSLAAVLKEIKESMEIWEKTDSHLYEKVCRALQVEA